MAIQENLARIKNSIPSSTKLVAVSKTKPEADLMEAYHAGQRIFGENKVQELVAKQESLPKDIEWHFIGHLQSNKVKYIAPFVDLIHGVDSLKLLVEINKQALKNNRIINCLLQFHIASEQAKFGLTMSEAMNLINDPIYKTLQNIRLVGVMGMATYTDDENQIRSEFKTLRSFFDTLKNEHLQGNSFEEISMGMSADYKIAIQEGSTMIRLGSSIFGARFKSPF
ncbi:MAG: YggS family pyridoxal phosphate-dependent enzyme [Bacteroidales bacterium]|nr:YggS family pyridoxal phosphate-dependent enzyme [Bacteroidales bacterium]